MKVLKVIGAENGSLILVSDDGERFGVAIDSALESTIRPAHPPLPKETKVSPREIQAHIRAGLSALEVTELTGAAIEYVERFEGPVVAEREHIVASALGVRVHQDPDPDPLEEGTAFGDVIRERLAALDASGERWTSWKDEEAGWIVKVEFTSDRIDHDARWTFDPRKSVLSPTNPQAIALSQQGEIRGTLIPRLRAVSPSIDAAATRFDTGAFTPDAGVSDDTAPQPRTPGSPARTERPADGAARPESTNRPDGANRAPQAAARQDQSGRQDLGGNATGPIRPLGSATGNLGTVGSTFQRPTAPTPAESLAQTSDLLDALRRRRGERDQAATGNVFEDQHREQHPSSRGHETGQVPLAPFEDASAPVAAPLPFRPTAVPRPVERATDEEQPAAPSTSRSEHPQPTHASRQPRRGRASMPSWDEIVFGARTDE